MGSSAVQESPEESDQFHAAFICQGEPKPTLAFGVQFFTDNSHLLFSSCIDSFLTTQAAAWGRRTHLVLTTMPWGPNLASSSLQAFSPTYKQRRKRNRKARAQNPDMERVFLFRTFHRKLESGLSVCPQVWKTTRDWGEGERDTRQAPLKHAPKCLFRVKYSSNFFARLLIHGWPSHSICPNRFEQVSSPHQPPKNHLSLFIFFSIFKKIISHL